MILIAIDILPPFRIAAIIVRHYALAYVHAPHTALDIAILIWVVAAKRATELATELATV